MPRPSRVAHSQGTAPGAAATRTSPAMVVPTETAIHTRGPPVRWASIGISSAVGIWVAPNTASSSPARSAG